MKPYSTIDKPIETGSQWLYPEKSRLIRVPWRGHLAVSAIVAIVSVGCATVPRASSRDYLSVEQSTLVMPYSIVDSIRVLSGAFVKRGYQMVDYRPASSSDILVKFRGGHLPVTTVGSFYRHVYSSSNVFGSVFVAQLTSIDSGNTKAYLFGKPTYNGVEQCTSFDPKGSGPCSYFFGMETPLGGQEEADTVRSVALEISPIDSAAMQGRLSQLEPKPLWKCHPSEDPRWKNADPYEKKAMLEACMRSP
jgi:hypothetical protein